MIPVHCIKSLVTIYINKRNCSSGRYATQGVTEVRVPLCKGSATEDSQAAAPGEERPSPVLSLARRGMDSTNRLSLMGAEGRNEQAATSTFSFVTMTKLLCAFSH